jgi:hypothetical protein
VPSRKLRQMLARHAARFFGGGGSGVLLARIKWALQLKARPPTFRLLLRGSERVDDAGQRFLANLLRQGLGMQGVPLRLELRCVVWSQQGEGGGGGGWARVHAACAWPHATARRARRRACRPAAEPARPVLPAWRDAAATTTRYNVRGRLPAAGTPGSRGGVSKQEQRRQRRQQRVWRHRAQRAAKRRQRSG